MLSLDFIFDDQQDQDHQLIAYSLNFAESSRHKFGYFRYSCTTISKRLGKWAIGWCLVATALGSNKANLLYFG